MVASTRCSELFLCLLFLKDNPCAKEAYFGVAYSAHLFFCFHILHPPF